MKKSSTFILEFTVIEPIHEYEHGGLKYIYRESQVFDPAYYVGINKEQKKSLFYLIMRPQNYKITKIRQNEDIINLI